MLTEFDKKLNSRLHEYRIEEGKPIYKIAEEAGINRDMIYGFTSGRRALNGESTKKLMDYLNLSVELKPKD